jgi:hypothetical protein
MTSTETVREKSRRDIAHEIEQKHFGRCLWQHVEPRYRQMVVECVEFGSGTGTAIVVRRYETGIPRPGQNKPWPELAGHYVYLPVTDDNTWEGLDKALTALAAKAA